MYVLPAMQKHASCQQAASTRPYITFSSVSQCACLVRPSIVAIADLQLVIRQQAAGSRQQAAGSRQQASTANVNVNGLSVGRHFASGHFYKFFFLGHLYGLCNPLGNNC